MFELTDRVALVTGGARGIGRGICLQLARAGAAVVTGDIDLAESQRVADEIQALGRPARAVALDVSDQSSVNDCIAQVLRHFARLDILVNNAGVFQRQLGLEQEEGDFTRCLDINLLGIWRTVRAVAPHFKARQAGKIVNIASVGGRQGVDFAPGYCASKAAVINLTQSLAAALGGDNINVNTVCPGSISTAMQDQIRTLNEATGREHSLERRPLARALTAGDIGYAVVFFASDASCNITGQALNVDCGSVMS